MRSSSSTTSLDKTSLIYVNQLKSCFCQAFRSMTSIGLIGYIPISPTEGLWFRDEHTAFGKRDSKTEFTSSSSRKSRTLWLSLGASLRRVRKECGKESQEMVRSL